MEISKTLEHIAGGYSPELLFCVPLCKYPLVKNVAKLTPSDLMLFLYRTLTVESSG